MHQTECLDWLMICCCNDNRKVRNGSSKWQEYEDIDFEDLQTIRVV